MGYLNVISLATAKNYLRVDENQTEDDADITRMIKGALKYVEDFTNVMVYARDKDFLLQNCIKRVYDYPINTLNTPTDAVVSLRGLYNIYEVSDNTIDFVNLNVGFVDPLDVPSDLIDVALEKISLSYYGAKEDGAVKKKLSEDSMAVLHQNKRFLI
jgi:hypothetical protein